MLTEAREQVWSCPLVYNIRDNSKGHCDWFNTPDPMLKAIQEITGTIEWK